MGGKAAAFPLDEANQSRWPGNANYLPRPGQIPPGRGFVKRTSKAERFSRALILECHRIVLTNFDCAAVGEPWLNYFRTTQAADTVPSKTNPGMLPQALEATGTKPEHAFIGYHLIWKWRGQRSRKPSTYGRLAKN